MGWFKQLFSSSQSQALVEPVNIAVLQTDIHSHLIPGIDDGCKTMEQSLSLIRQMKELGYKKLITTPHIMSDFYKNTPEKIHQGLLSLRQAVKEANIDIEIEAAAEYLIDDGFQDRLTNKELLTFGKNYVLIELSFFNPPQNLKSVIFNLQVAGYKVILAHPERYSYWYDNLQEYEDLKARGVFFQMNAVSLSGYYSEDTKKVAKKLVDLDMIDFLGTDLHNESYLDSFVDTLHNSYLKKLMDKGSLLNRTL